MTTALSILQPWAWLIVNGHKPVENREWRGRHRGPLLIHAGKGIDRDAYEFIQAMLPDDVVVPGPGAIERGGIVGQARMVDCVTAHPSQWFFGPYGFVLADAQPLPFRRCRGQLGFFDVDYESLDVAGASAASSGQGVLL